MIFFESGITLDEQDRDVIIALGTVITEFGPESIKTLLQPTHAGVTTVTTDELNARLERVLGDRYKMLTWGMTFQAHRHHVPRLVAEPPQEQEDADDHFASIRDRLSSSAKSD